MIQGFRVETQRVADVIVDLCEDLVGFLIFDQIIEEGVLETAEATA